MKDKTNGKIEYKNEEARLALANNIKFTEDGLQHYFEELMAEYHDSCGIEKVGKIHSLMASLRYNVIKIIYAELFSTSGGSSKRALKYTPVGLLKYLDMSVQNYHKLADGKEKSLYTEIGAMYLELYAQIRYDCFEV